jgi:hypothetical protein
MTQLLNFHNRIHKIKAKAPRKGEEKDPSLHQEGKCHIETAH